MDRQFTCQDDLLNVIEKWYKSLEIEQRLSKHTLRAYITDLDNFLEFLSSYEGQKISINTLSDIKIIAPRAWLSQKAQNGISKTSRARSVSSVRNFFQFLDDSGVMHNPVFRMLSTPKTPHRVPRPVDIFQAEKILQSSLDNSHNWTAMRDYALFSLLYGTGLRIQEALSLKIKALETSEHDDHMLRVMGKGGKERLVPLLDTVKKRIYAYLDICPLAKEQERYIFIGLKGQQLNQGMAQKSMRRIRKDLGLPDSVTPHALRHSYATHLMGKDGLNLREIQELLGHASLSSTQIYTEVDAQEMLNIYKAAHPRNK